MAEAILNPEARLDVLGTVARQKRRLDLHEEVLAGGLVDPAGWWRELADTLDGERGDRCRSVAALLDETGVQA